MVDETYLAEALTSGLLAGAGLDVFEYEPLAVDSTLRSLENVILTPHIGWTVEEVFEEFAQIACTQLFEYLHGTLCVVGIIRNFINCLMIQTGWPNLLNVGRV